MIDRERIKRRIRALLNLAEGDGAAEGEIDNAMRMAAELMQEHQLEAADVAAAGPEPSRSEPPPMDTADAWTIGAKVSTWESTLAWAVVKLIGSVQHYRHRGERKSGTFGTPTVGTCYRFYGPAEDAALAAEMVAEWGHVIATMAAGRYGGCFRGDGAMYAYGFAQQLYARAIEADKSRREVITESTKALVLTGDRSLADVLARTRSSAAHWLATSKGVKLSKSSGGGGGYRAGSHDALAAGRADGARAAFSATRRPKLT